MRPTPPSCGRPPVASSIIVEPFIQLGASNPQRRLAPPVLRRHPPPTTASARDIPRRDPLAKPSRGTCPVSSLDSKHQTVGKQFASSLARQIARDLLASFGAPLGNVTAKCAVRDWRRPASRYHRTPRRSDGAATPADRLPPCYRSASPDRPGCITASRPRGATADGLPRPAHRPALISNRDVAHTTSCYDVPAS